MEYRGIQLNDSVKLYKKDGSINKTVKTGLDKLAERLKETGHILQGSYKGSKVKILIDYGCGHKSNPVVPTSYTCNKVGCPECAGNTPDQAKKRLIETVKINGHVLISDYKGGDEKVFIDFKCGHEPHDLVPYAYFRGQRCPKCSPNPKQAKKDFYQLIHKNNHIAVTEYEKANKKVLIDFSCGHKPHLITPADYKNEKGCPICGDKKRAETRLLQGEKAFRDFVKKRNHILIGKYKGMQKNVRIDFKCGHEPELINASTYFHRNGNCKKCTKHCSEQAKEEFFLAIKVTNHEVLSEYKGSHKKILIDFKCGHKPKMTYPYTYKIGHGCSECGKESAGEKYSESARKEFPSIVKARGDILLTPYGKNGREKVLIDFQCEHEPKWIFPNDYKYNGAGCIECGHINMAEKQSQLSREEFPLIVKANGHELLSEYGKNNSEKVLIEFRCGHKPHTISPADYKLGYGCPECGRIKSNESRRKRGEKKLRKALKENDHILLSDYIDMKTKVLIDFQCVHRPHWVTPDSYTNNDTGCPTCKKSKGVKIICKWLEANEINYDIEFRLPNRIWRYDIFVPSENTIIEVHGDQHYKESKLFHNGKNGMTLKKQQQSDRKKQKFAELLGYEYLIIDYHEHIPKLALERFLKAFNQRKPAKKKIEQLALF